MTGPAFEGAEGAEGAEGEDRGPAVVPHTWVYGGTMDEEGCDECPYPRQHKGAHPDHLQPRRLLAEASGDVASAEVAADEVALPPLAGLTPDEVRFALNDAAEALENALALIDRLRGASAGE